MAFVPPTADELAAVARIRPRLMERCGNNISPRITDTCILRFYRGIKWKEDQALEQLVKHQQWRVENNVDDIHNQAERFQKHIISGLTVIGSYDKKGRPAAFNYVHKHNPNDRDIEEFKLFLIFVLESLVQAAKPEEERFTIVMDMHRFSLSCMDYEAVKSLVNILQTNYSDTLETFIIIDAPMIFSACWSIIKPWIDPITAAKVNFVRRSKLTDFFDEDQIPQPDSAFNSMAQSGKYITGHGSSLGPSPSASTKDSKPSDT